MNNSEVKIEDIKSLTLIHINNILKDLKKDGYSDECPEWDCKVCKRLFPKVKLSTNIEPYGRCPCLAYTKVYLIKRLTYILEHWPE